MDSNYSYITLCSHESYIGGITCMKASLDKLGCKYPLSVLTTQDISQHNIKFLEKLNINIIETDEIISKDSVDKYIVYEGTGWHKALTKLKIFDLTQFKKLVYLDADMWVKSNLDYLFDKPHMSAWQHDVASDCVFCAGLLVVEPNHEEYEKIIDFYLNFKDYEGGIHDQLILNKYYSDWIDRKELHLSKYTSPYAWQFDAGDPLKIDLYTHLDDIKVIHFANWKPWEINRKTLYKWDESSQASQTFVIYYAYMSYYNAVYQVLKERGITSPNFNLIDIS